MRGCPTRVPRGARVHPRSQILSQAQIEPPELPLAQCVLTAPRSALDVYSPHPDPCAPPQVNSFEEFRSKVHVAVEQQMLLLLLAVEDSEFGAWRRRRARRIVSHCGSLVISCLPYLVPPPSASRSLATSADLWPPL